MSRSRDIPDDSDEKWRYTEHSGAKHEVLRRYLGAWLPILGRHPRLVIYDGFAGRGRYLDGEDGSPLIIFKRAVEAAEAGRVREVEIVCVEANRENFRQLEENIGSLQHPRVRIRARNEAFDIVANEVADGAELRDAKTPPPIFFTADPYGFRGVPLNTIARLMSIDRMEVLVTFMARDQRRFIGMENVEGPLTELFGGEAWRSVPAGTGHRPLSRAELPRRNSRTGDRHVPDSVPGIRGRTAHNAVLPRAFDK